MTIYQTFAEERRSNLARRQRWLRLRAWARRYRFELLAVAAVGILDLLLAAGLALVLRGY